MANVDCTASATVPAGFSDAVNIEFLPTPDAVGLVSPQDTAFTVWVLYVADFNQPVEFTAPTSTADGLVFNRSLHKHWPGQGPQISGRIETVEIYYIGGGASIVFYYYGYPLTVNSSPIISVDIAFNPSPEHANTSIQSTPMTTNDMLRFASSTSIQLTAPEEVVSGGETYYFEHWLDEVGVEVEDPVLLLTKAASAESVTAVYTLIPPGLGLAATQHFSGTILVTDSGLTSPLSAGQHKIQRGTWSERFAVPDSEDTLWVNPFSTVSRTELIEGKGNVQTRFAKSLDGDWDAAQTLEVEYSCPYGIESLGMLYISAYKDSKQWLLRRQRHGTHTAMEAALEIADSDEVAASLAFFPLTWALACAVQHNGDTKLYLSRDHGQSWSLKHTVADLLYPSLFCDGRLLWLSGYVAGAYEGASGRVSVAAYNAQRLDLEEYLTLDTIGPSDEGRSAVARERDTWLLRVLAPRTTDWGDGEAWPAIVEYVSDNVGGTWTRRGVHVV